MLGDRYRPIRPIGQGGFGKTFLAVDEHIPSNPACVVKQFFPPQQSVQQREKAIALFHQEAMRLDELGQHPQIPKLLAHFSEEDQEYLVQTYISGQTLEMELAQAGCFGEEQIRQVLADLLPVLQFIHDRQVIHRDIKPANIIRRDTDGQLVLVDFGASKFATQFDLNRTGTVIGSAGYAAPEQVAGKAVFSSDLYSLGVTCLYLLTDVSPFDLYSFVEGEWMWRDYLMQPVSESLGAILDRMVAPVLSRRYAAAAHVLQDLDPVVPVENPASNPWQAISKSPVQPTWHCVQTLTGHQNAISAIAIHPGGKGFVSGSFSGNLRFWQLDPPALLGSLTGHLESVTSLMFTLDGTTLISASVDNTIKLWNPHTESLLYTLTEYADAVMSLSIALSPDQHVIVSGSDDHTIKIWQLQTGKRFRTLMQERAVTAIALSPDGRLIVSGSSDNQIRLWDFATGELLETLNAHQRDVNSLAISPDGQILVSGSGDHTVKVWDLPGRSLQHTLTGHLDWVRVVAVSPCDRLIASGSSDHTVKLWDMDKGELVTTLMGHTKTINAIAFAPDGQTLISGSSDRTLKLWQKC